MRPQMRFARRQRWGAVFGLVLGCALIVLIGRYTARAQTTSAPSLGVTFAGAGGTLQLTGHLYRPDGEGPFPALVLLHGCGGISPTHHVWAETLRAWGYVALLVDSLGPRGATNVCDNFKVDPQHARMPDAYAAQSYLASQAFVDGPQIGVMGWSHGGTTTLYAVDDVYLYKLRPKPFRAAIAFYPGCLMRLQRLNAPLLILIGEDDDWTPAARCKGGPDDALRSDAEGVPGRPPWV